MSGKLVAVSEVCSFIKRCLIAVGTPGSHAASLAEVLVLADYRGHFSHGLNRLGKHLCGICFLYMDFSFFAEMYVNEISNGQCDPHATPRLLKESPGTAFVDGQNGIGTVRWSRIV